MNANKASAARCHLEPQAWSGQPVIPALSHSPLRRLTRSMFFTSQSTSYQTTCTVSERSSIKGTRQYKPTRSSSFALRQKYSVKSNLHEVRFDEPPNGLFSSWYLYFLELGSPSRILLFSFWWENRRCALLGVILPSRFAMRSSTSMFSMCHLYFIVNSTIKAKISITWKKDTTYYRKMFLSKNEKQIPSLPK